MATGSDDLGDLNVNNDVLSMICGGIVVAHTVDGQEHKGIATSVGQGHAWLALIDEAGMDDVPTVLIPLASIASIEPCW